MCVAHLSLPIAASTCHTNIKVYSVLRWCFIFGGVLLYRLSVLGLAVVLCAGQQCSQRTWIVPLSVVCVVLLVCGCVAASVDSNDNGHSPVDGP